MLRFIIVLLLQRGRAGAVFCVLVSVLVLPSAFGCASRINAVVPVTSYAWPVKPFDEAHAVRSNFGDPRTWFDGPPVPATLYSGAGSFSFHFGIDIAVPDGTPVYAVRSGEVSLLGRHAVLVASVNGLSSEYWHIVPAVSSGQHVLAYDTILGRVLQGYGHVHFSELIHGRPVNPLAAGHLTPYDDSTPPRVGPIEFRRPGTSLEQLPELVRGRVELVAAAQDEPQPHAPGTWATMPTAPALVTWRVERPRDGAVVLRERSAFDVRSHLPPNRDFWQFYARGTRQNMATFNQHRYWREEGVFLFRLGVLDTHRLRDGIYIVVVTARDIRGNTATTRRTFLIWNRPGWPPETPQA